ncbi:MAG: hypothetical protein ABI597_12370 [Gammaproteobacteria bacterium]
MAKSVQEKNLAIAAVLLDAGLKPDDLIIMDATNHPLNLLKIAILNKDEAAVKMLLEHKSNPNQLVLETGSHYISVLSLAITSSRFIFSI